MTKRLCAAALSLLLVLCGCSSNAPVDNSAEPEAEISEIIEEATPRPEEEIPIFIFDRAVLPADLYSILAEHNAADSWTKFTDALFSGKSEFSCDSEEISDAVIEVFEASPYSATAELSAVEGSIDITYNRSCTPGEFEAAVAEIGTELQLSELNTTEAALAIYRHVSSKFVYSVIPAEEREESSNSEELNETTANSLYRFLTEGCGGTREFASALHYLFSLADIPSYLVDGAFDDDYHTWVIAELDGECYNFDPTFEHSVTGGLGLSYFGMSDEAHADALCSSEYSLVYVKEDDASPTCPESIFDGLFCYVTAWELDTESHELSLEYDNSNGFSTKLDIRTLS